MESGEAALTQESRPMGMRCGSTVSAGRGQRVEGRPGACTRGAAKGGVAGAEPCGSALTRHSQLHVEGVSPSRGELAGARCHTITTDGAEICTRKAAPAGPCTPSLHGITHPRAPARRPRTQPCTLRCYASVPPTAPLTSPSRRPPAGRWP